MKVLPDNKLIVVTLQTKSLLVYKLNRNETTNQIVVELQQTRSKHPTWQVTRYAISSHPRQRRSKTQDG